ncbi:MAG: NAD(P)-binding domain-containing protein, partial [Anaerolineales bacterium]
MIKDDFLEKIRSRAAVVGVVGLGYVGLPLAMEFAQGGLTVIGIDVDERKITSLGRGESYIADVPAPALAGLVQAGKFRAVRDY